MGKLFAWLDRNRKETVREYDNRINRLQAFHAGYAFLSLLNYSPELSAFSAYAVWNGEFNEKLENPMPQGGFMLHCGMEQAQEMCERPDGFPIFVKLCAKQGRLAVERMFLADADRIFDFYFNGCEVIPPERLGLVFAGARVPENAHREEYAHETGAAQQSGGSYRKLSAGGSYQKQTVTAGSYRGFGMGSYRKGFGSSSYSGSSDTKGSYPFGRSFGGFGTGSYRQGSYWQGTYWLGSYWHGSYWRGSYQAGAFRSLWMSSYFAGSYAQARFGIGSYAGGSFRVFFGQQGSFASGSFRRNVFFAGSYRESLFRRGSFWKNGSGIAFLMECAETLIPAEPVVCDEKAPACENRSAAYRHARIIEEMGYGLDLI